MKLLRLFFDLGARVDAYSDIDTYYTGLWDAIWDNKSELVELLLRQQVEKDHGRLDVLVNNAGVYPKAPTLKGQLETTLNTNVIGAAL